MFNLDSDGVFASWRKYVLTHHFQGMSIQEFHGMPELHRRALVREMYLKDPDLFYKLDPIPEAAKILETVESLGECWAILTSGSEDHFDHGRVVECKKLFFEKHFGVPGHKVIVTTNSAEKATYADKGRLLVDDYGRNCREWVLKNGTAIYTRTDEPDVDVVCRQLRTFAENPFEYSGQILCVQ